MPQPSAPAPTVIATWPILLAGVLLVCITPLGLAQQAPDRARPNVVLIYADDLGFGELGCYGQEKIRTPRIDALASRGIRLTRFYAGAPVCAPSRCVLMTGTSLDRAAIRDNTEGGGWGPEAPEGQSPLPADEVTLAELLGDAGYVTAAFGKWGLGGPGSEGHPCFQGFDHFYGYLCQRVAHNYYPTHLWRNHDVDVLHGNDYFSTSQRIDAPPASEDGYARYRDEVYAPGEIRTELLGWLDAQEAADDDRPFFVYFATVIPHLSLQVPQSYVDMYPRAWDEGGDYLGNRGYLPHPRPRAAYAGMISYLDESVGLVVDWLDRAGELDDTLIIITSDNGATGSGTGGADTAFFDSSPGLRGAKGSVFEGGLLVPLIACWPGQVPEGTTSERAAGTQDLLATICEAAGIDAFGHGDGESMLATLRGESQPARSPLFWEFGGYGGQQAVIDWPWKLVRQNLRREPGPFMLFNLEDDPSESRNLSGEQPGQVERLSAMLAAHRTANANYRMKSLGD